MYSYEDRIRAVKFYITCGYNAAYTVSKLGYPDASNLKHWYKEYSESNDLHKGRKKVSKFSDREKRDAVDYYFAHDRNALQTVKALVTQADLFLYNGLKNFVQRKVKDVVNLLNLM